MSQKNVTVHGIEVAVHQFAVDRDTFFVEFMPVHGPALVFLLLASGLCVFLFLPPSHLHGYLVYSS